jgi:hypothetical protein
MESSPLLAHVSYPMASAPPADASATPSTWLTPVVKPGFSNSEGSGAVPSAPEPSAPPVDPVAISSSMDPGMHAAIAGRVDFIAIGIPSRLEVSKPVHMHTKSMFTTSLLIGGVAWLLVSVFNHASLIAPGVVTGFAFLIYLIESCCSDTRKYLSRVKSAEGAEEYVQSLVDTAPDLVMQCRCYHHGESNATSTAGFLLSHSLLSCRDPHTSDP